MNLGSFGFRLFSLSLSLCGQVNLKLGPERIFSSSYACMHAENDDFNSMNGNFSGHFKTEVEVAVQNKSQCFKDAIPQNCRGILLSEGELKL